MAVHFFVFLYLLLIVIMVEKFFYQRITISQRFEKHDDLNKMLKVEKLRRRGFVHLAHTYLMGLALILIIMFGTINFHHLSYYLFAIFFSASLAFIYLTRYLLATIFCWLIIVFLSYLSLTFLIEEGTIYLNPSFYLLISLAIFSLYVALRRT